MSEAQALSIAVEKRDADVIVSLRGEFDLDCQTAWTVALDEACRDADRRVTIDLGEVTFIDSSGLRLLLEARRGAEIHRVVLELVNVPSCIARVFEIAGLVDVFAVAQNPMSHRTT